MIKGFAGTAVEMEDFDPSAFDIKALLENQKKLERRQLTAAMIAEDIETDHLQRVFEIQFLKTLVEFVPALAAYKKNIRDLLPSIAKKPINPSR